MAASSQFSAIDNEGATSSSSATATIEVKPVNDKPTASAVYETGSTTLTIPVTLSATDVDGAVTKFQIVKLPPKKAGVLYADAALTKPLKPMSSSMRPEESLQSISSRQMATRARSSSNSRRSMTLVQSLSAGPQRPSM